MRLGVLYSGGKDSTLALIKAKEFHEIVCLITLVSENKESFMFHTPNIELTSLQAQAMKLPQIRVVTKGQKEQELEDLKDAIAQAKKEHKIDGIVTGAVRSTYQASRIQNICKELDIWCFNPLWLMDQIELLNEVIEKKITAVIGGVFAEPLTEAYLGRRLDKEIIAKLAHAAKTHKINPAGEGGEIETTVIDAPCFNKKLEIVKYSSKFEKNSGVYEIEQAQLVEK